ncbi:MAG: ABC transporter permease [Saprospiraceae bacterium]|nr:ABC transporter permease [Saprospiraceae bacterium]MCB0678449.1 ABC transporter permease [Saprospiraceae bacterium]
MILNHLKISLRSFRKYRLYTAINVIGLAVGIAASLLLFRIVKYESGFNRNFAHYDRIVRVTNRHEAAGKEPLEYACIPIPAMDVMESTVPQFEKMTRIKEVWSALTVPGESEARPARKFAVGSDQVAFFVEDAFFEIFDLNWLAGDARGAMADPGKVVLSRSWAEKCFDNWERAPGQTLMIDNIIPVQVVGVVEDLPPDCDFPIQYFVSYPTVKAYPDLFFYSDHWGSCSSNNQVFALLTEGADREATRAALAKVGAEEYSKLNDGVQHRFHDLQPLADLHYNERLSHSGTHYMNRNRLKVLSLIGILILVMACFNFINLATAQATMRAKEVGIKKTLGGRREQLIGQFMTETALLVLASILVSLVLSSLASPLLHHVSHVPSELPFLTDPAVGLFLVAVFTGVTLLAGLYPAFLLSGYRPAAALHLNTSGGKGGGNLLRKTLVVLQFAVAQALIIGALVTILQMDYIRSKDLGFSENLIYTFTFNIDSSSVMRQAALKQELLQAPGVEQVSFSSDQPLSNNVWDTNFRYADRPEDEPYNLSLKFCDADYGDTYGIRMLAGQWYAPSDTMREAVINETLLRRLGLQDPHEAVGQTLRVGSKVKVTIAGVTEDFHTQSLRTAHDPLLLTSRKEYYWEAGVKIRPTDLPATIAAIQGVYDKVFPEQVFSGNFLDERIARLYADDQRMSNTSKAFGLLAVLISCLGLFGLATHAAARRIKEIGIRKVLGASVSGIVGLLSSDFLKLVLLSLLLAGPVAYYLMQQWLADFVYRIHLDWWIFALTGLLTLFVAFATVSYQSIRAALANPVNSLKTE